MAFEGSSVSSKKKDDEPEAAELYEQIGRLKVELEWFKKSCRELVTKLCSGLIVIMRRSVFAVSARFWESIDRSFTTNRNWSLKRILS